MKYSIILLTFDPEKKLQPMIDECIERIHQYSKGYDYELILADESGPQLARNNAYLKSTGEYIMWICSDILLDDPEWLPKLTQDNAITGWMWVPFHITGEQVPEGSCICIPREVHEVIGLWDMDLNDGYGYDENDLYVRAEKAGYALKVVPVKLKHLESQTLKAYNTNEKRELKLSINRRIFLDKWPEFK